MYNYCRIILLLLFEEKTLAHDGFSGDIQTSYKTNITLKKNIIEFVSMVIRQCLEWSSPRSRPCEEVCTLKRTTLALCVDIMVCDCDLYMKESHSNECVVLLLLLLLLLSVLPTLL